MCITTYRKHLFCRRIHTENKPIFIKQHKTFTHRRNNLLKFIRLSLQSFHLRFYLFVLLVKFGKYGSKFFVCVVISRVIKVKLHKRICYLFCHCMRKKTCNNCRNQNNCRNGRNHYDYKHSDSKLINRNTKHISVIKKNGFVKGLFGKCGGVSRTASVTFFQCLSDFFTSRVIFHFSCIRLGIIKNYALWSNYSKTKHI